MGWWRKPVLKACGLIAILLFVIGAAPTHAAPANSLAHLDALPESVECDEAAEPAAIQTLSVADLDAQLRELYDVYADLENFVDVYYVPDQGVQFFPTFIGAVPEEARGRATPVPVEFQILPEDPTPLGPGPTPDANDIQCLGIQPGNRLGTAIGICTVAFIFTNGNDYFFSTAGHCIDTGGWASLSGIGTVGTAVFSTGDGGVGNDFALVKVDENREALVKAEMCFWAGPTGAFGGGSITGQATVQVGHGGGSVWLPPRPKPGVGISWGANSFTWAGTSVPGDSGSGIRLKSGDALGVVTHLSLLVPVQNFGTRWDHGLDLAGMSSLTLMTVPYTHL